MTARAKTSERLRMNFNLHDSLDAKAQRLLNALEPGTALPVHRHPHTDETYVILRGRFDVIFCDEHGRQTQRFALDSLKGVYGIHVPKGQWHTLEVLESGTMLLKGYGLSLFYPVPEHRPCGDIDIWLFGRQPEADKLVAREWGVPVDVHKEHHTTFDVDGIMVENHYDFVNKETHASNARLERLFKQYAAQPGESVAVAGVAVYLPSEQLNALFLLRHAAVHFAAINIGLRHVLDWCVFVAHCHDRIDWPALYAVARETRMVGFLNCLNALCVDCLGLEAPSLPDFERDAELEKRVLDEILSPAFSGEQPEGLLRVVRFKTRRWWANRWKHRLVFDEGLAGAFVHSAWAHLKRPRSIAH